MKKVLIALSCMLLTFSIYAQTEEELKQEIAPKKAEIAKLQGEVDALKSQIDALPGWKYGAFGTVGGSISSFNNWFSQGNPNVSSGNIGITVNAFANKKDPKYFWRNALSLNLGWVKFDDEDDPNDEEGFREALEAISKLKESGEYPDLKSDNFNENSEEPKPEKSSEDFTDLSFDDL